MTNTKIIGGATIWARQTLESDIFFNKPDKWFKIWFYIVNTVNHKTNKHFPRGTNFIQYKKIEESTGATKDQIKHCMEYLKSATMIATQKTTRGMILSVVKYDYYQDLDNYKYDEEATQKANQKPHESHTINKNDKNDKNTTSKKEFLQGNQINELIEGFKDVNPMYKEFFKNKTERQAIDDLARQITYDKLKATIEQLPKIIGQPYAPKPTKPSELKRDLGKLIAFSKQKKSETIKKTTPNFII
jgi:hypothetical protein